MWGTDLDIRPPGAVRRPHNPYGPQPSLKRRAGKAVLRGGARATGWGVRRGWRHRVKLAPVYLAALVWLLAAGLHLVRTGPVLTLLPIGLCALLLVFYARYRRRERRALPRKHHLYLWGCWGGASGWLVAATVLGATTAPLPGVLVVGMLAAGSQYWWHRRIRPAVHMDDIPDHELPIDPIIEKWVTSVQADGGVNPGTELDGLIDNGNGWESPITFTDHRYGYEELVRGVLYVSRIYDVPLPNIALRPADDGTPSRAHITVMERNPLAVPTLWAGPTLDRATGVARIGGHPDGRDALCRFWRPGSGPVHDLISGCSDAGKSRITDMLLAEERHSDGLIASWIIDPQRGQSLPAWKNAAGEFAASAQEGVELLCYAADYMYQRNQELAELPWLDAKGRTHYGVDYFDPTGCYGSAEPIVTGVPLISITVDEAHKVLEYEAAVKAAEDIAGMGRKCGFKLRLITQLPLLPQLGNSMYLRDQVAAGNVIVLRTASPITGQVAFNGALPGADPATLPRTWPDGSTTAGLGYLLGASSHQAMFRADLLDRESVYDWVESGETLRLDRLPPKERPALAAVPNPTDGSSVAAAGHPAVDPTLPTGDRVLAYVRATHGTVRTGILAADLGISLSSASKWLGEHSTTGGPILKVAQGEYIANRAATA